MDGVTAFTKDDITKCPGKGNAEAHSKFVSRIAGVFQNPHPKGFHIIEFLLEWALDNKVLEIKDAVKEMTTNGYGVKIQVTKYVTRTDEVVVRERA